MNTERRESKVTKDKIKLYQHIPAAVAQFCHAAPVASFKGFIKCSILQMQCPEHSHCKSNQKHSAAERPQSTVQSELLLFRTAPGMESFSSIYQRIGLKWNGDALCELLVASRLPPAFCRWARQVCFTWRDGSDSC